MTADFWADGIGVGYVYDEMTKHSLWRSAGNAMNRRLKMRIECAPPEQIAWIERMIAAITSDIKALQGVAK